MLQILAVVAAIVLALGAVVLGVLLGWRAKSTLVFRPVWWFSKRFMNPRQLQTAGTPGAYAGIIRARGRRSGQEHETPVGVVETNSSALIALPYGTTPQWLKNVQAAGSATIVHEGRTFAVDRPEIIPMAGVARHFPDDERSFRLLGVDSCLRLRIVEATEDGGRATTADAA